MPVQDRIGHANCTIKLRAALAGDVVVVVGRDGLPPRVTMGQFSDEVVRTRSLTLTQVGSFIKGLTWSVKGSV